MLWLRNEKNNFHLRTLICRPVDSRLRGSNLTGFTVLCPRARHIHPCLVLVQQGRKKSKQTKVKTKEKPGWATYLHDQMAKDLEQGRTKLQG